MAIAASQTPHGAKTEFSRYKLVFVGDVKVGKTSIIGRYVYGSFNDSYQTTIGIDFLSKSLKLEGRAIRLQLWDTAGQERFRSLIPSYIRDSSAVMIVYDITCRQSFESIAGWIQHVRDLQGEGGSIVLLVGNKFDLASERQVSTEEGEAAAKEANAMFFEVSAKAGDNIDLLFEKLVEALPVQQPAPRECTSAGGSGDAKLSGRAPEKGLKLGAAKSHESKCAC